jgi:amidase
MGLAEDYITLDAMALAALVRQRQVSPAELVEAAIVRLEQVDPKLAGMAEWTLDEARRVTCEPFADASFTGVPFLLKDNMHVAAGLRYHNGSRIWRGWVPPQDSELVRGKGLLTGSEAVVRMACRLDPVTTGKVSGFTDWSRSRTPDLRSSQALVGAGMPLKSRARAGRSSAKKPADGTAQRADGKHGHERVFLHRPAHGLGALLVVTLGLRQVPPALLHVGLTAPVETVGETRGLVDR